MKKSKLIPALVLASTFVMAGCGDKKEECSHVDANKDHLCDKCGEKISDHSAKSDWKFDSVNHWHECNFDGCFVMLDKAPHSFGEWETVTPATYESAGQMKRTCACGYSEVKGIPQLVHQFDVSVWNHDEHSHWHPCTDEGFEELKGFEAEHTFGRLIVDVEPTCDTAGSAHQICSVCGERLDVELEPTGHVNVKFHQELAPTCTKDGHVAYYTCANEPGVYYADEECTVKIDDIVIPKTSHDPVHHEAVAPTCELDGHIEYWTCNNEPGVLFADEACSVELSEDDVIIPATGHDFAKEWSSDDNNHWHECLNADCEEVSDLAAHVDENGDFECDVCEKELKGVEGSIVSPLKYIGRAEMFTISSSVTAHGGVSDDVYFEIVQDGSRFDIFDNEDGTAIISTTSATATQNSLFSCTVNLYAKYDDSLLDSFTLKTSTYGSNNRSAITGFFNHSGVDFQFIPFMYQSTLTKTGTQLTQTIKYTTIDYAAAAFDNQGTWTKVSYSDTEAVYQIVVPGDPSKTYKAVITATGNPDSPTMIVYTKVATEFSEFPADPVNELLKGKTESKLIAPDDGSLFTYVKTSTSVTVTSNGDADAYLSKLSTNKYYVVESGSVIDCVSPERTLVVSITKSDSGFKATYKTQCLPTKTEWALADSNKMIALVGEEIPFVANDYGSWYVNGSMMYAMSSRYEASAVAVETLDKETGYEKSVTSSGVYYTKDINEYSSYSIHVDGMELYIELNAKEVKSWLGDKVAEVLEVESSEIPAPVGTSYYYMFADHAVDVQIIGGDLDAYKLSLEGAGYLVFSKYNSFGAVTGTYAVSSNKEIAIMLGSMDGGFGLSFSKQAPLTDEDWTTGDKEIMNSFMGDVLPFINDGFAGKWYLSADQIYATSYRIEAQAAAKAVFDADSTFEVDSTSTPAIPVYKKSISKYQEIIVKIATNGMITVTKQNVKLATWEADDIAAALGSEPKETLPVFEEEGATFSYEFGEDTATIFVFTDSANASMVNYKDALIKAGFTSSDDQTFKSPTDTLTAVVSKVANKQFKIVATGHLPEGQYRELPTALIAKQLNNDAGLGDLALPEGDLFFYEAKDKYQCDVTVLEGGSMSAYISALGEKGFALNDGAYEKEGNNIRIVLTAGEGDVYSAHLSLIEEPVIVGWTDEIKQVIANLFDYCWVDASADDLPYPSDPVSVEKVSDKSFKVTGIDMGTYKTQLEEAGWKVTYYEYNNEYDVAVKGSYYCFYIMEQPDGSVMFTYTYY